MLLQARLGASRTSPLIRAHEREYSGQKTPEFAHDAHQFGVVLTGALTIHAATGTSTTPAGCGIWIPARTRHSIEPRPVARVRPLYIYGLRRHNQEIAHLKVGSNCCVVALTPLMRALVDHLHQHTADKNVTAVLIDQLATQQELPLFLAAVSSPMARRVAEVLTADPADTPRIRDLATAMGVSARTLERAFVTDARMPLGEWRQRARISRAIALLADRMDVKDVALEVGYETPSAFFVAFKRYAGVTPGKAKHEGHEDF